MKSLSKIIIVVTIIGLVGYAATSFAGRGQGWGKGWGGGYCDGPGSGWAQKGYGGPGYPGNMSDEQIEKLNVERQAFFNDTSDLRQSIYQKQLELRSEMAKNEVDENKALSLQKEISDLKGQMAQKRIQHRIRMQKENPDFFSGRGYGYGSRGMGHGFHGKGMGRGFRGQGGGCW
jgi:hypothetical protein